jgi:negative regulator of flagellin synthesis FlgM
MKIPGDKPYIIQTYVKKVGEGEKVAHGKKTQKQSSKVDRVEISTEARQREFTEIKELLDKVPDVREEKVAALKTAIEDETYDVKGKEIAKKMIEESIDEFV